MDPIEILFKLEKGDIQAINGISKKIRPVPIWVNVLGGVMGALGAIAFFGNSEFIAAAITFWAIYLYLMLLNVAIAKSQSNRVWKLNKTWHSPMKMKFTQSGAATESIYSKTESKPKKREAFPRDETLW